jgi:hypothetical protein
MVAVIFGRKKTDDREMVQRGWLGIMRRNLVAGTKREEAIRSRGGENIWAV